MTRREDKGIVEGQWDNLNRAFYERESGPHEYIAARLRMLAGVEDRDVRIVESVNLLHHAAEALVRHYLAHRNSPECPWLEMARLRDFPAFKAAVSALGETLERDELPEDLVTVFCGPARGRSRDARAAMTLAREGLSALLAYASDVLVDESGAYNAIKHGIAAVPGVRPMPEGVGAPSNLALRGDGASLLTLQPRGSRGARRWVVVVTYVDVEANLAMTGLITEQLENLWHVARAEYLGVPLARLHPITEEMADRARYSAGLDAPPTVHELSASLVYRENPSSPSPAGSPT